MEREREREIGSSAVKSNHRNSSSKSEFIPQPPQYMLKPNNNDLYRDKICCSLLNIRIQKPYTRPKLSFLVPYC